MWFQSRLAMIQHMLFFLFFYEIFYDMVLWCSVIRFKHFAVINKTCFIFPGKLNHYQESHWPTCSFDNVLHPEIPRNASRCTINLRWLVHGHGIHMKVLMEQWIHYSRYKRAHCPTPSVSVRCVGMEHEDVFLRELLSMYASMYLSICRPSSISYIAYKLVL